MSEADVLAMAERSMLRWMRRQDALEVRRILQAAAPVYLAVGPTGCPRYSDSIHRLRDLGRSEKMAANVHKCSCGKRRLRTDEGKERR